MSCDIALNAPELVFLSYSTNKT